MKAWGRKEVLWFTGDPSGWGNIPLPGQLLPASLHTKRWFSPTHRDQLPPGEPGERESWEVQKTTLQKEGTKNHGAELGSGAIVGPKSAWASCFLKIYNFVYLFIFGHAGSLLLQRLFSSCSKQWLLSGCSAWASLVEEHRLWGAWVR